MATDGSMTLGARQRFAFAFLSVPLATGALPLVLYLTPYYASVSSMSLATIGLILTLTRSADMFVDPLIGALSDRTPARWGRRGLWIAAGVPVMAAATIAVFDPFLPPTRAYLFWSVAALFLGWTLIGIPLSAWVAELSTDYDERSRLTGARAWGGIFGALYAILLPLVLSALAAHGVGTAAPDAPGSLQPMLRVLAWSTVVLLVLAVPCLLVLVPQVRHRAHAPLTLRDGLALLAGNRAFRRLLAGNALAGIGWNIANTLFMFFVTGYLGAGASQWPLIILAYFVGQLAGTPLIVRIAPNFTKHRLLAVCSLGSIGLFSGVLLLRAGDYLWYVAINLFNGLMAPSIAILGPSMAADVIDEDHLACGRQRGALFMALWAMADKLAIGLAAGIALPAVQYFGFDPSNLQDETSRAALKYAFCALPVAFFLASVACIWHYPLDRARHDAVRMALAVRTASDP